MCVTDAHRGTSLSAVRCRRGQPSRTDWLGPGAVGTSQHRVPAASPAPWNSPVPRQLGAGRALRCVFERRLGAASHQPLALGWPHHLGLIWGPARRIGRYRATWRIARPTYWAFNCATPTLDRSIDLHHQHRCAVVGRGLERRFRGHTEIPRRYRRVDTPVSLANLLLLRRPCSRPWPSVELLGS